MLTTVSDFVSFMGGSGTYRSQDVQNALYLAEQRVGWWLNTAVEPTANTEEDPWPVDDGKSVLAKTRLISITSITGLHTPTCTCSWTEIAECAYILNDRQSIIQAVDCNGVGNSCWPCRCPKRVRITYQYGFSAAEALATTPDGALLRASIFNAAYGFLQSGIGLDAAGGYAITSWSSVGYSESRQYGEKSGAEGSMNAFIVQAREMVRPLMIRRGMLMHRARKTW